MPHNFSIPEFCKNLTVPAHVADKICKYHMPELQLARDALGSPIRIRSGYCTRAGEIEMGRSGQSEHVFRGRGAVDVTADDLAKLGDLLKKSNYHRVCWHPSQQFFHCDFKGDLRNNYFVCYDGEVWERCSVWKVA